MEDLLGHVRQKQLTRRKSEPATPITKSRSVIASLWIAPRSYFGRASLRARLRRAHRSPPPSPPPPRSIAGLARQASNERLHTGCGRGDSPIIEMVGSF